MANVTVSADANHDDYTATRLAGEDFTINSGATLVIDSMPHLTSSGILGDITLTAGTLHIDGTRTFEVAYSGGSGTLPVVGATITWNAGADTGKVVRLNSGNNVSGVLTLTKDVGEVTPDDADTLASGGWSADVDSVKVGFLIVYGEDQDWGAVDAQSTLRINGDWYEVGVGDGTDGQTVTLPHTGHQHAVWVETGNGTGVFEIWHRVASDGASAIHYNAISQFGNTFQSGYVFTQTIGNATLTFGDSTNGGVPPNGARIRIPNVHIGTTTTGSPTTEVNLAATTSGINLVAPNVNLNVEIDHLNASTAVLNFRGTNAVTVSDTCWSYATTGLLINRVNASVTWDNVAVIYPSTNTTGSVIPLIVYTITDNVGGITINNSVVYGGTNASNTGALLLTTIANIDFTGTCKIVSNIQDENTTAALRGTVAVNVTAETLILLGGALFATAGCNNWTIDELIWGLPPGRGTTEQNINWVNLVGTQNIRINSGNKANGGAKVGTLGAFTITDAFDIWITNFGAIDSKISGESRMTYVANIAGISSGVTLKRLWFDTLNSTAPFSLINSAANVLIENCSGDYNDEIEPDANRTLHKGVHGGSGGPGSTTGIEDDNVNVIGTCFYDLFASDTTGFVGLVFNDKGNFHASDVTTTAGTPFYNGLGDLVMNTVGDQIIYEFPYWIKGHTGFANTTPSKIGVNPGNISAEYALDSGSGYGAWTDATGANLNAESINPSGFRIKFRFTTTTGTNQNLRGFAIYTTTTLADQAANYYPLSTVNVQVTVQDASDFSEVQNARVLLEADTGGPLPAQESVTITRSGSTASVSHTAHGMSAGQVVIIRGANQDEYNGRFAITNVTTNAYDFTVSGTPTTPATGTITATAQIMTGLSNASGVVLNNSFEYSSDQPVIGYARKASGSPNFKQGAIVGTITSTGFDNTVLLVRDE